MGGGDRAESEGVGETRRRHLEVEGDAGVGPNALLPGAERPKVLRRPRHHVGEELHHDPPFHLPSDADVHVAPRVPLPLRRLVAPVSLHLAPHPLDQQTLILFLSPPLLSSPLLPSTRLTTMRA